MSSLLEILKDPLKKLKGVFAKQPAANSADKKPDEKEYTFIWYFRMQLKSQTVDGTSVFKSFTKPCRTKIKAASYKEAQDKLTDFALGKCELKIWQEDDYVKSDLYKQSKTVDEIYRKMDEVFKEF